MAYLSCGYQSKLKNYCDSIDPFTLDVRLCVDPLPNNVGYFDIVNYCIERNNLYSWQSFKAYRNMDAFQFFKSGFVQQTSCYNMIEKSLILACVKHPIPIEATHKPLRCWISLDNTGVVLSGHCTCISDMSDVCCHIVATLFLLEDWSRKCHETGYNIGCVQDSQIVQSSAIDRNALKSITKTETFECDSRMDQVADDKNNSFKTITKLETLECNSQTEQSIVGDRNIAKSECKVEILKCDSWIVQSSNRGRRSLKSKSKLETFECDKCSLTFNRKWNLDRHLLRHKMRDRPNVLFPKSTLQLHTDGIEESQFLPLKLRRKPKCDDGDEGKDFLCNICAQLFRQRGTLTQHMKLHGDVSNIKPKIEFSNEERNAMFQFLSSRTNDGKLKNGAMTEAATEFNCNRATISNIWRRAQQSLANGNKYANVDSLKKNNCGRKRKDYSENISKIHQIPLKNRRSFRSLSDAIGVPKSTLYHILKRSKAKVAEKD